MPVNKSKSAFRTIAEVAEELDVATHVLRFWETKFPQIQPMKRSGGRRYYRPDDIELLRQIKSFLHEKRFTIEGLQKLFKENGTKGFTGETIMKDFFEVEAGKTAEQEQRKLIVETINKLQNAKDDLQTALNSL
jgi:DNA-binding transcriptional MerR regulator